MRRVSDLFGKRTGSVPDVTVPVPEGRPLKILVRGDCTSRRSVNLNLQMFGEQRPTLVQNEKSTFIQFLDAAHGFTVPPHYLGEISDAESMPRTLKAFYLGQAERSVLDETGADLLMLDSWGDVNFEMHEHRDYGFKLWVHKKFLRDPERFAREHVALGRRVIQQSVDEAVALIRLVRLRNPGIPVLFLNQQVDHYPRLPEPRTERYYTLGQRVAERLDDVFYGGVVPKELLELDDIGSAGGPGNTLHFQAPTYRRMWATAMDDGLGDALQRRLDRTDEHDDPSAGPTAARPLVVSVPAPTIRARGADDRELEVVDTLELDGELGPDCTDHCREMVGAVPTRLARYFYLDSVTEDGLPPEYTPMLIDLEEHESFEEWEQHIKRFGKGARLRQKRKATEQGYYTHDLDTRLHVPDIYELNTSMEERSGGAIRSSLTRSIEELGGYPTEKYEPPAAQCPRHWTRVTGVFQERPGHRQGDIEVGEQLVGYVSMRRLGEFLVYGQIIGHGDHIRNGVMALLHHDIVERLHRDEDGLSTGMRWMMYGGAQNGTPELFRFKRQAGFKPYVVDFRTGAAAPAPA